MDDNKSKEEKEDVQINVNNINTDEKPENKEKFKQVQDKSKKVNKKLSFFKKYLVFLIILVMATGVAIYNTIKYLKPAQEEEEAVIIEESKNITEDIKYVASCSETYDKNDLKIISYYDIDGNIIADKKDLNLSNYKSEIGFIQIEGLKNKNIEDKVNNKLRQTAYNMEYKYVGSNVEANYGNILSIIIYGYGDGEETKTIGINIDLTTGDDIPFEKVFLSSAPIKSFLIEGLYENLAWDTAFGNGENMDEGYFDMDKADISSYEDKGVMLVRNYEKNKDNINYYISYNSAVILDGILDNNIIKSDRYSGISIDFTKHTEEIAIYKRYLTPSSIFENNEIGEKNIIVFTDKPEDNEYFKNISYGKIADNIFLQEVMEGFYGEENPKTEVAKQFIENYSKEQKTKLKSKFSDDMGAFVQREYVVEASGKEIKYYAIYIHTYQATCTKEYFKEDAFKDYIKLQSFPRVEIGLNTFTEYDKDKFPNLKISKVVNETFYISPTGEILGITEEEAKKKTQVVIDEVQQKEEELQLQEDEIIDEEDDEIIEEEEDIDDEELKNEENQSEE